MTSINWGLRVVTLVGALLLAACGGGSSSGDITPLDTGREPGLGADDTDALPDVAFNDLHDVSDLGPETDGATGDLDVTTPDADADIAECVPGLGGFGCPCSADDDCLEGYCVWDGDARVCTRSCTDTCPAGWTCAAFQLPDPVFVCVSLSPTLCRPCADAADCAGAWGAAAPCLDFGPQEGSFCGGACEGTTELCPVGTTCGEATTVEGVSLRQCLPDGGTCSCSANAILQGLSTPCAATNAHGTCPGVRACEANGLTACDATTPVAELCGDGLDQDCDGVADDGFPDSDGDTELDCVDLDDDDDGEKDATDCAPLDPVVNHASTETCNGQDDDCDGQIDADDPDLAAQPRPPCEKQAGFCAGAQKPLALCALGAWQPCNDATYQAFSSAYAAGDASCNGVDNDCDDLTDEGYEQVPTTCGVGACAATGTRACAGGHEVDSCVMGSPAADDTSCDGIDDDCNGAVDEGYVVLPVACGVGACQAEGTTACLDGVETDSCDPGDGTGSDAICNGLDDDCDGLADEDYVAIATTCGVGACAAAGQKTCVAGVEEDSCQARLPAVDDASCDGLDDDCDGLVDEEYLAASTACGAGACASVGTLACLDGKQVDTCEAGLPADDDTSCDAVDDDCNGTADDGYTSHLVACGVGACQAEGTTQCVAGVQSDSCQPLGGAGTDTACNALDDDCDGLTDEEFVVAATACGVGACTAQGERTCVAGVEVDSCVAGDPAVDDVTCDGRDDDCNGTADDAFVSATTACGAGSCARTGATTCVAGVPGNTCEPGLPAADDASCNAVDDDCDGLTDDGYVPRSVTCGVGACQASGTTVCEAGTERDSCSPAGGQSTDAVCNQIDDDCDGATDEDYAPVATACGVGACSANGSKTCVTGIEIDSCTPGLPAAHDANCDAVDDDCNGVADDDYVATDTACGTGGCAREGRKTCVNGVEADSCAPGPPAAHDANCDARDDNCDGATDEGYGTHATACGVGACYATGTRSCVQGVETNTCTPGLPAASDADCDAIDDDCSAQTDEDFVVTPTTCGVGACARVGQNTCVAGIQIDSCAAGAPAADDANCDAIDDDCSGANDEDYVVTDTACGVGACARAGQKTCVGGTEVDSCKAGTPATADATCNGVDDDCSGANDEDYVPVATQCGQGACSSTGQKVCASGAVVDTCTPGAPSAEVCNTFDDDCDGKTDAADPTDLLAHDAEPCANQAGVCGGSTTPVSYCVNGAWVACDKLVYAAWSTDFETPTETTCDGLDNDCNAQVDENGDAFCDDDNACTFDACSSLGACGHLNDDDAFCPGGYCLGGVCNGFVCQPEQPACDGDVARTCTARGDGYLPGGLDCAIVDKTCRDGECVERCGALRFDGLGDYVQGPSGTLLGAGPLTVEAWVLPQSFGAFYESNIVATDDWTADIGRRGFVLYTGDGHPGFKIGTASDWIDTRAPSLVPANQWAHLAGIYDGASLRLYVNGALVSQTATAAMDVAAKDVWIGDGYTGGRHFHGLIDEVRISNKIRYSAAFTPAKVLTSDANTLLLYRFSETSDTVADDQSPNGYDGTILGADHVQESPLCTTPATCGNGVLEGWEECDDGNAVSWDGCTGCEISEFLVNTYTPAAQTEPRVATFADGRFVVVWSSGEGSGLGIGAQLFDATGAKSGSLFQVNTFTTGDQQSPVVATQPDGHSVVAWVSAGQDGSGAGVYAQRLKTDGTKEGSEFRVNSATTWWQNVPAITSFADGRFVITWHHEVTASNIDVDIEEQRYSATAEKEGNETRVNTTTTELQVVPDVTTLTNGRHVTTWTNWGTTQGLFAQILDGDGNKYGAELKVNAVSNGTQQATSVAPLSDGGFVVAWPATCGSSCTGQPDNSGYGLWGQRFDGAGAKTGSEFLLNTFTADNQRNVRIAGYGDGRWVAAWSSNGQDGSNYGVYGQRFGAGGSKKGPEFRINRYTTNDQMMGAIATFADGRFVVVYQSYGQDGSDAGIYARLYDADGQALLPGDTDHDGMPDGVDLDDDDDGSADNLDCAPRDGAAHPGAVEVCDAKDNDCDGATDEGLTVAPPDAACPTAGVCAGHLLVAACTAGAWVCDYSSVTHHEATEVTCDGLDNDCDGAADENGTALCDDANVCTDDTCKGVTGCGHVNNQAQCDSGYCDGGACHPWVCTPDEPACDGDQARTCNASGSGFLAGATNCAATGQVCAGGACVAPCHSLAFDGSASYVQGPAGSFFTPSALTVEAWVRADAFGTTDADTDVVGTSDWSDGTARGWVLRLWKGVPSFYIGNGPAWYQALSTAPIGTGAWVHLAGQYDGQNVTLFVNGKKTATRAIGASIQPPALPLRVGGSPMGGKFFDGLIDEVRVSSTIRYTSDFEPATVLPSDPSTMLLYHFAEGTGTTTEDASGNGYSALLYGATWSPESPACAAAVCVAGAKDCNGSVARECGVLGDAWLSLHDCAASGQTCASGACVGTATCCTADSCMAPQSCVADANAGSCGLHSEAFTYTSTGFDGTYWAANGSVYHSSSGYVSLTTASGQGGSLWYKAPVSYCGLKVDFSYYVTARSMIADGFALVMQDGGSTTAVGLPGGNLGAGNLSGISVRFQFFNKAWYPVRVFHDPDNAVICTGNALPGAGGTYALHVESVAGRIKVVSNGTTYLDCDVSTYLPKNGGLVGWTAATGAFGSTQRLTNTVISGPCNGKPGGVCQ